MNWTPTSFFWSWNWLLELLCKVVECSMAKAQKLLAQNKRTEVPQEYLLKKIILFLYFGFHLATATDIRAIQDFFVSHILASPGKKAAGFYTELEPGCPCVSHWEALWWCPLRAETQHSVAQAPFHAHEAMLVPSHGTSLWHQRSNLFLPWQHFLGECLHWAFRHATGGQWELPCPPEEVISRTGNWTLHRLLYPVLPFPL